MTNLPVFGKTLDKTEIFFICSLGLTQKLKIKFISDANFPQCPKNLSALTYGNISPIEMMLNLFVAWKFNKK